MGRENEPMYLPLKDWQKQHADIIGTTGAGKGVAAGILLYQSILAGEGVLLWTLKTMNGHRIFTAKPARMQASLLP